jgi:xanthine dehydrogenase/oxidase
VAGSRSLSLWAYTPRMEVLLLRQVEVLEDGLRVGASVPLSTLLEVLRAQIKSLPEHKTSTFRAVVEQLRWFAGVQV